MGSSGYNAEYMGNSIKRIKGKLISPKWN